MASRGAPVLRHARRCALRKSHRPPKSSASTKASAASVRIAESPAPGRSACRVTVLVDCAKPRRAAPMTASMRGRVDMSFMCAVLRQAPR